MSNPMVYILKKLTIFCRRILRKRHPTLKAVKGNNTRIAQMNRLVYTPYLKRPKRKLALKSWLAEPAKPPPFSMYSPLN